MKHFNIEQRQTEIFESHGAFFAFSNEQFEKARVEGVKYASLGYGMIAPKDKADSLIKELGSLHKGKYKWELANNSIEEIIWYELQNHEAQFGGCIDSTVKALKGYGITREQVQAEYKNYFAHCVKHDLF